MLAFASSFVPGLRLAPRAAACARRPPAALARRRMSAMSAAPDAGPIDVAPAVAANRVIAFTKSSCPYCAQAKAVLEQVGAGAEVWDLKTMTKGKEIQAELLGMTGQRTVPNIFIGGEHVGGCSDLMDLYNSGNLEKIIESASIKQ